MKSIVTIFLSLILNSHIYSQWTHIDPPVALNTTYIDFADDQHGYISLENGTMWKTINGGQLWTPVTSPQFGWSNFFNSVSGVAFVDSGIGKTVDGGQTWTTTFYRPAFFDSLMIPTYLSFLEDKIHGYVAFYNYMGNTDSVFFYKTSDGGNSWTFLSLLDMQGSMPFFGLYSSIMFADSMNGYFSVGLQMFKTTDGGVTWLPWHTFQNPVMSFHVFSPDTVLTVEMYSSSILKTNDNGLNWQTGTAPVNSIMYSVHFINSTVGYICGGNGLSSGYIIKSTDGGLNWSMDYNDVHTYSCFSFPESGSIYVGGEGGAVIKYSEPSDTAHICFVTVDSISQHNVISWDKAGLINVDSFIVYREITTNDYRRIGSVPFSEPEFFTDTVESIYFPNSGNPNTGTFRYKLQMRMSDGSYSVMSPYHNTIFIANNSGTFVWPQPYTIENSITPVSAYVLMRDDSSNGNWHQVNSVTGSQQIITDPQYAIYQNIATWRVQTLWNINCTPLIPYTSSSSNMYGLHPTGTFDLNAENILNVFPNPCTEYFTIQSSNYKSGDMKIFIYDTFERIVKELNFNDQSSPYSMNIDVHDINAGFYIVKFIQNGRISYSRVQKK